MATPEPAAQPPGITFESADDVARVVGPMMKAIAAAVGPHCEVVLHDLRPQQRDLARSIIAIENGHVTGRRVGGPSTNLGFEVVHDEGADHDAFGYRGRTADGRELSCSSVYYRNTDGRIVAALCVNVDLTPITNAQLVLGSLLPRPPSPAPTELFGQDLNAVLDDLLTEAISVVGKPVTMMNRTDRVAVVRQLDRRGALHVKRAAPRIAARLGVSRVTIYAYLDEVRS